ncbi:MAG: Gfo/Idh/MocA family oxidoreductase [Chitinophagaceae bacterium]|nr:Gfo/Idh/MocA family oxidoreductase [Chitinophagaceae bacterium]MCZ2397795.1 Gfo/Idh/MocA family oxidoreductase [Chitinophagales bacterium]
MITGNHTDNNLSGIKTALFSFGMSGKIFHAPFLKVNPRYSVTGVLERTHNLSEGYFPNAKIYRTPEEIWADDEVELVIINTPNRTHYEYALNSLKAGKHVVVEKPFTITSEEGYTLASVAAEVGKVLTVYHNRRYDSDFRTIRKILAENRLGEITEAEFRFDRYRLEPGKKLHKEQPGAGTGNLYDLGSHLIDQALVLFGWPDALFADIEIMRAHSRVDDYFELILMYGNMRVKIHSTYVAVDTLPGYALYGTEGAFIKEKTNIQEEQASQGLMPDNPIWGTEPESEAGMLSLLTPEGIVRKTVASEKGNYGVFYDELFAAIREGAPAPVTPSEAIDVIRIIEKAYQSNREKCVINLKKGD